VNSFEALGLPVRSDLSDDQVRAAWRAVAADTHPDRPGGDVADYTAAANAYAQLRTAWGRSEAYADLASARPAVPERLQGGPAVEDLARAVAFLPARIRHGRPWRLLARAVAAGLLSLLVLVLIPGQPAGPALVTGLVTWFVFSARADLAPPPEQ
jgi:hypothetical protein